MLRNLPRITCIVAHPDDEVLWAAGLIMRSGAEIICCSTPERDPQRGLQFAGSCKALGTTGMIFAQRENEKTVLDLTNLKVSGLIASHNELGEYGHPHHVQLHEHFKPQITFGFRAKGEFKLKLTADEQERKLNALKAYTMKWKDLFDTFRRVFEEETYDSSCPAGREILAALCGDV